MRSRKLKPLAAVLAAIGVVAFVGLVMWTVRAREQANAVQSLRNAGYEVTYRETGTPLWLANILGQDFVSKPYRVVGRVNGLRMLEKDGFEKVLVGTSNADIKVLTEIENLPGIEELSLGCMEISSQDILPIRHMNCLRKLNLANTRITDRAIDTICKVETLEELSIAGTGITDASVAKLASLGSLKKLHAERTELSARGKQQLQEAIPSLQIDPVIPVLESPLGDTFRFPVVLPE